MNRRERRVAARKSPAASKSDADRAHRADPEGDYLAGLGSLLEQQGLHEEALKAYDKAVQIRPDDPELWARLANVLVLLQRPDHAILGFERALKLNPRYWYAAYNYAVLLLQSERFEETLISFNLCDELQPDHATTLTGRGRALYKLNRFEEALSDGRRAQALDPANADICIDLGVALQKLGQPEEALQWFDRALDLRPGFVMALINKGSLLLESERFEESLINFNLCDELQSDHAATLFGRSVALYKLNRFEEALSDGRRAQALDPANADICNAIGVTLHKLGRPEDALQWFDRALDLRPDFVKALNNKAFMLGEIHRFDEAFTLYRHVKRIDPENAETDWNVALIQMLNGDFEAGWPGREARWKISSLSGTAGYPKFPQPIWLGEETIEGKTILICADEGLGDTIQFVRYAPMLAALGARVILLAQDSLYPLLSGFPGVSQCLPNRGGELPPFDFHCPIMSLPLAFRARGCASCAGRTAPGWRPPRPSRAGTVLRSGTPVRGARRSGSVRDRR
jgi:tetratricopeptide (TPR) repeat protein